MLTYCVNLMYFIFKIIYKVESWTVLVRQETIVTHKLHHPHRIQCPYLA